MTRSLLTEWRQRTTIESARFAELDFDPPPPPPAPVVHDVHPTAEFNEITRRWTHSWFCFTCDTPGPFAKNAAEADAAVARHRERSS